MLPVPVVRQARPWSCGAAALLSALVYWKAWQLDACEVELHKALGTCAEVGTEAGPIVAVARSHGLKASYRKRQTVEDLRKHLARGATVLVALQAWADRVVADWTDVWDSGHWVVLVGMDEARAWFMDPSTFEGYVYLDLLELDARWHDLDAKNRKVQGIAVVIRGTDRLECFPAPPKRLG